MPTLQHERPSRFVSMWVIFSFVLGYAPVNKWGSLARGNTNEDNIVWRETSEAPKQLRRFPSQSGLFTVLFLFPRRCDGNTTGPLHVLVNVMFCRRPLLRCLNVPSYYVKLLCYFLQVYSLVNIWRFTNLTCATSSSLLLNIQLNNRSSITQSSPCWLNECRPPQRFPFRIIHASPEITAAGQ